MANKPIIHCPSPNFERRRDGLTARYIVIHATEMASARAALERLCDASARVSTHYLIDTDGQIFKLVEPDQRAWHCGESAWQQDTDLNSLSVGIELQNQGFEPFPAQQIESLLALLAQITQLCPEIAPHALLAHSDIAPTRKQDPSPLFPWRKLAAQGFGLYPPPILAKQESEPSGANERIEIEIDPLLQKIGYCGPTEAVRTAFCRHYLSETLCDGLVAPSPHQIHHAAQWLTTKYQKAKGGWI